MENNRSPNKKVLMLCYKFPPEMSVGSLRSRKYAQYLDGYGWNCQILTASLGQEKKMIFPETVVITAVYAPDFSRWLSTLIQLVQSFRSWIKKTVQKKQTGGSKLNAKCSAGGVGLGVATTIQRWLLLPDPQFLWILFALPFALWGQRTCQVIYSSAWPLSTHTLGLLLHKITKKPWIADYRDEWTLNTQWFPPTRFHRWLGEKLDAACVRNARFVVNTTETRTANFVKKFAGDKSKYITIHNGYDRQDIAPYLSLFPPTDKLVITSIGSLYGGRDARLLLAVVAELIHKGFIRREELVIKLIGGQNDALQTQVDRLGINACVQIIPRIPQPQAFEHLAQSHIALLIGSEMERYAMTTKLYEYAGMGKKIFALVPPGPVYGFVIRCGGTCAMYNDKEQIEQSLCSIVNQFHKGMINNDVPAGQEYERRNLAGQLANRLNECIGSELLK